jgi:Ca2+-binding EF-hand superfamily protein
VNQLRAKVLDRSAFGIRGLQRIFKAMDIKGDSNLDVDDFRWGLMDFGIQVTKDEAAEVLKYFDKDGNGKVNFQEFVNTLKVSQMSMFLMLYREKSALRDSIWLEKLMTSWM